MDFVRRPGALLLVAAFIVFSACDQTEPDPPAHTVVTFSGTVGGAYGLIVPGASVELRADDGTTKRTVADDEGAFSLSVAPGTHTLTVEKEHYVTYSESVSFQQSISRPVVVEGDGGVRVQLDDPRYPFGTKVLANTPVIVSYEGQSFEVTTNYVGDLKLEQVPSGNWQIEVIGSGGFRGYLAWVAEPGANDLGRIQPEVVVPEDGYGFELVWEDTGANLDLHLTYRTHPAGPFPTWHCEPGRCYRNGSPDRVLNGYHSGEVTSGPGVESIVLFRLQEGTFRLSVTSTEGPYPDVYWMADARVNVYKGEDLIRTYPVPMGNPNPYATMLWRVIQIDFLNGTTTIWDNDGGSLGFGNWDQQYFAYL